MPPANQSAPALQPWQTARLILRVGSKIEASFEDEELRNVWFPATIIEGVGKNLFLVEYKGPELRRATVDLHHIRPLSPHIRVTSFDVLDKVDAFHDFGWWSGVINTKLADSRYIVYFRHINKQKEFNQLELRPLLQWEDEQWVTPYQVGESREIVSVDSTNLIGDTTITGIDNQTSTVTTHMKRTTPTSVGSNDKLIKPRKKARTGVASDDLSLSDVGQSKEVGKQAKAVALKHGTSNSANKKGRLSVNDDKGVEASPQGDAGESRIAEIGDENRVTKYFPNPIVLGLPCDPMTFARRKKSKRLPSKSPSKMDAPAPSQAIVPLAPKTIGNMDKAADGDTIPKRKRGRPFKNQAKTPNTSAAVNNQNGELLAASGGIELMMQHEEFSKVTKGKRGKRGKREKERAISSIQNESSPRDFHVSSTQTPNGNLEIVDRSIDTVSDDQPLSRWIEARHSVQMSTAKKPVEDSENGPVVPNGDAQRVTFEKRNSLWESIESSEAFCVTPQNPHFHPLNLLSQSARERQALTLMVNFSGVFEETFRLTCDSPRTEVEDLLETLTELESHGFDVNRIRDRLTKLLSTKDNLENLQTKSKEFKENIKKSSDERGESNQVVEEIEIQMSKLRDKRSKIIEENERKILQETCWKDELARINKDMDAERVKFDALVKAPL